MANIFCLTPCVPENPALFPTLRPSFVAAGHTFVDDAAAADVYFIDLHSRLFPYSEKDLQIILQSNKPCAVWDEWDRGSMSTDEWPWPLTEQQGFLFGHFKDIKVIHFSRLLDKTKVYPSYLCPFEKPYAFEIPIRTPENLFERPYDICYIANAAPSRISIAEKLLSDKRLKCDILIGAAKLPFDEFLQRHKRAKFFISSAAGGYTDERVQLLFSVAAIIRQRTNQWVAHDFTDCVNCVRIDAPPTKEDLDSIYQIANDKDYLYEVYSDGYNFVKQYWSAEAMGKRYIDILTENGIL